MTELSPCTDIEKVQEIAISLLKTYPVFDEKYPFIVHHPFAQSDIVYIPEDPEKGAAGNIKICSMRNEEEVKEWRRYMQRVIRRCKTVSAIMVYMSKPYYFAFIKSARHHMDDFTFGDVLHTAWISMEFPNNDIFLSTCEVSLMMRMVGNRSYLMGEENLNYLKYRIPDEVTVYRGVRTERDQSERLSWTLSEEVARKFARSFSRGGGFVYKGTIKKEDIIAYFDDRNEKEVVGFPENIELYKVIDSIEDTEQERERGN